MVTVDDATYVKMKDTLYWGDAWKASRAKAQIEANYDDAKYNDFMNQLNSMGGTSSNNSWPADWYATATDRNMATGASEFWRNNQTSSETPSVAKEETKTETVTETPEVKQEWALKPLSQDYYNQTSQDAQDQIVKNLNDYKKSNPEYFTDYESFKRNFSYDARDEVQKNTLDQWYKWYQDWLTLSSTPTTDLYTQYKNWDLSDAQLQNLRVSDPNKYAELMNQINKWNIVAAYDDDKWMDFTWNSIQEMAYQAAQQMFMQWLSGDSSSWASQFFREYEEKMDSPEMKWLSDKTTELQEQIENIQDDIASMQKAVEKEYEWTWASRAKISAIVADRTYDLQLQLRTANSEYNKYATQYNNRMQQYQNEFQLWLQEYQINQQARQQQMNELWFAMDLMSFETPQQQQERQWEYWVRQQEYANWNINSKDYNTRYKAALTSVQNLLSQYEWIPMVRSAEEMAQDILTAIDGGSNLWAELTKINKQIQAKPEYKYLYNNTYNPAAASSNSWFWKTIKVGDMEFVEYNGGWYTAEQIKEMFKWWQTWSAKPYEMVDESAFSLSITPHTIGADGSMETTWKNLWKFLMQKAKWTTWWQCGKFVNDYLEYIWMTWAKNRYYDDNLSTKLNSINSYDPKVWTIAVFDYNHKSSDGINHGHVGIVTKVTNDWVWVRDSNYWSDEKIQERFIPKDSTEWNNNLKWFFDPSRPPIWSENIGVSVSESVTSNLTPEEEALKKTALAELTYWMLTNTQIAQYGEMASKQGWNDEWITALNQNRWANMTQDQSNKSISLNDKFAWRDSVKDYKDAVVQLEKLLVSANADNWVWDMAAVFTFMKTLDPSSVVREWEFQSAAKTAWVLNPAALWQKVERLADWEILTPSQREDFIKVAKEYVKSHSKAYELEYKDLQNQYKVQWIPEEALPINRITYVDDLFNNIDTSSTSWWSNQISTSSNSFKNITLPTVKMKNLTVTKPTASTKSVLQSKYWLM